MQNQRIQRNDSGNRTNTSSNDKNMFTCCKDVVKSGRPTQIKKEMKLNSKTKRNVRKTIVPSLFNESNIITILETLKKK